MRKNWTFGKTIFVFSFILVIFGCATNKNQSSNANIGFIAETVPEGISLTFSNIPKETVRLSYIFKHGM